MKQVLSFIVHEWEEVVGGSAIVLMVLTACLNVFTRYVLKSPLTWAEELECICLVWSTFLCSAAAYKHNLHYGMDFLVDHLPYKGKIALRRIITFINIFLFGFLCVIAAQITKSAIKTTIFFRLSYKYIDVAAFLAFLSMFVYSIIYFIESFRNPEKYINRYAAQYDTGDEKGGV